MGGWSTLIWIMSLNTLFFFGGYPLVGLTLNYILQENFNQNGFSAYLFILLQQGKLRYCSREFGLMLHSNDFEHCVIIVISGKLSKKILTMTLVNSV